MQKDSGIFDDMARMATGAAGTLLDMKRELEAQMRAYAEKWLAGMHPVTREEFEMVKEMAAKARAEQEVLTARLAEMEKKLERPSAGKKPARK